MKQLVDKLWRRVKKIIVNKQYLRLLPAPSVEVLASEWPEFYNVGAKKKVLYLAAKYDYGDRSRGMSYEEYNFFYTLKNMHDIEVVRLDVYSLYHRYGKDIANKVIKEVALLEGVDSILMLLFHDIYDHDMFKDLSDNYDIETILWLFDDDKRYESTKDLAKCFNKVVTTLPLRHEQRLKQGLNSHLAQFAANHYLYKDYGMNRDLDVVFIGQNFGNRQEYIDYLRDNGVAVHAYGRGWSETGRISQVGMIELLNRAKIALNFSASDGNPHLKFLKGRVFEIPATGAILLTEECEGLDEYFEVGEEVCVFTDKKSLLTAITSIIDSVETMESLSRKGKKKVCDKYTFENYLREVI